MFIYILAMDSAVQTHADEQSHTSYLHIKNIATESCLTFQFKNEENAAFEISVLNAITITMAIGFFLPFVES